MTPEAWVLVCTLQVGGLFTGMRTEQYQVESVQHCNDLAALKRTVGKFTTPYLISSERDKRNFTMFCGPDGKDCPVAPR